MRHAMETLLAAIVVPGIGAVFVPYLILQRTGGVRPATFTVVEAVAFALGIAGGSMALWVCLAFVRIGRGTPIPLDPPKRFVAVGLFRWVRNPMYLGVLMVIVAEAILFRSTWVLLYALALWAGFHVFLVLLEEPQLARRFGRPYLDYRARTPRWIPRPPRRPASG